MTLNNIQLSVIAPIFNEEDVIETYIETTIDALEQNFVHYELILIDDGSTDHTVSRCLSFIKANKKIRLISFSRNYGHEIASTAGLDHAQGDYVVLMDADLQHPPAMIPALVKKALEGYDVVCASRDNRESQPWSRQIFSKIFYHLCRKMTGFDIKEDTGNFRLLSRTVVESLKKMKESNRHLMMMFAYVGFNTTTITYHCPPRLLGKSRYSLKKLVNLSLDSIIGFSAKPLRIMSILSVFTSMIMMGYAGYILVQKLLAHQRLEEGLSFLIFLISGLFSVLFLFLAVISEYISRILIETKNRPLYNIKQDISHDKLNHPPQNG